MILAAMFLVPIIPVGIAFANELTYPLDETVTQGYMLMLSQAFGFVLSLLCIQLSKKSPTYGVVLMCVCAVIAAGCTLMCKEDL